VKGIQRWILGVLLLLVVAALGAILYTHDWADSARRLHADQTRVTRTAQQIVDTSALQTAQQLAPLAVTRWEQEYAQEALRLADRSVDLAFDAALDDAKENPAPLTAETHPLAERVKEADARWRADQDRVADLTAALAKARPSAKDAIQDQLDLANAQMGLDKDEMDDADEDLTRAGGDKLALVQNQLDQHEAGEGHGGKGGGAPAAPAQSTTNQTSSPEASKSKNLLAQVEAIFSLGTKESLLAQARQNALDRVAKLTTEHEAFEKQLDEEKSQKKIVKRHRNAEGAAKASSAAASAPATTPAGASPSSAPNSPGAPATNVAANANPSAGPVDANGAPISQLDFVKRLSTDQKAVALFDKRIEAEQSLATTYGNWLALVVARRHAFLHGMFISILWILLIALFIFLANSWVQRFFTDLSIDRRRLQTMRALAMFVVQAVGVVLILLVIVGIPSNFATIAALATAGITVAMKDFIVGFFGWFVLMGENGIRPGDWVEINGVGGEVLQVGLLHTVILETGSWSDAGHPTGRKVTFVNSFAIEGHYFNFSTSGQWLWDEIQVQVPADKNPYAIAEEIQKLAADETQANAQAAEQEWDRVTPSYAKKSFSAAPALSVKPSGSAVEVRVRYITRANERHEVRGRLYRGVLDLLHDEKIPETAAAKPSS
jgi:small-conductance mechanosensitive channel